MDLDPIEVFNLHTDKVKFYPEVPSVLANLSGKYDLIIASGIPSDLVEIILKIQALLQARILSCIRSSTS